MLAGLAACVADPGAPGYGRPGLQAGAGPVSAGRRVAILLPLSGQNAEVGQSLLKAAQLALDQPGSPPMDSQDTAGTPEGAAAAARLAVAGGAGLILGPLTQGETAAVAPVARAAGVPVLAFTSDAGQGQPGVWALGITPSQQVRRLVQAVQAEQKTRVSAALPQSPFGDALASGLASATAAAALPEPRVVRYQQRSGGLADALKDIPSTPAPAFDALLLGASGQPLYQAAPLLVAAGIAAPQVRVLGPALWAREASRLGAIAGAWYAAPDPAQRAGFERQYATRYSVPPRDFASLAFDTATIARTIATPNGFALGALTRPEGFAGADGLVALQPDGQVRRGLAIFEIDRAGSHMVQPAPQNLAGPGI